MCKKITIPFLCVFLTLPSALTPGCAGSKAERRPPKAMSKPPADVRHAGVNKKAYLKNNQGRQIPFTLIAKSSARSKSKKICRDKAVIFAEDKLRLLIVDTLSSLLEEGSEDASLRMNGAWLKSLVFTVEILGVRQASIIKIDSLTAGNGQYHCRASLGLKWAQLFQLLESECRKDNALCDRVRNLSSFKRLKTQTMP